MCQTPSDIYFFLCVLALFTLKLLPWVSKAQDLKVSAEALWSKLGKSAEKCCKTKGQKRKKDMESPAQHSPKRSSAWEHPGDSCPLMAHIQALSSSEPLESSTEPRV